MIEIDRKNQAKIEKVLNSHMQYKKFQYLVKWLEYSITHKK